MLGLWLTLAAFAQDDDAAVQEDETILMETEVDRTNIERIMEEDDLHDRETRFAQPDVRFWEEPIGVGLPLLPTFRPWVVPEALDDRDQWPTPLNPLDWSGTPAIYVSVPVGDGVPDRLENNAEEPLPAKDTLDRR